MRRLLEHPLLCYAHFAPPCGTASRARSIPLGPTDHGPRPLRSEAFPAGLPHLHEAQQAKVSTANLLYNLVALSVDQLSSRGLAWSIENPRGSYMWLMPAMKELLTRSSTTTTSFQACARGSKRPKWTTWVHSGTIFSTLEACCPGEGPGHAHSKWGREPDGTFATSQETAYPERLCEEITRLLLAHLGIARSSALPLVRVRGELQLRSHRPQRLAAARQPKAGAGRQLMPEFDRVITIEGLFGPTDPRCQPGHIWGACKHAEQQIPKGAKTIRTEFGGTGYPLAGTDGKRTLPTRGCIKLIPELGSEDLLHW